MARKAFRFNAVVRGRAITGISAISVPRWPQNASDPLCRQPFPTPAGPAQFAATITFLLSDDVTTPGVAQVLVGSLPEGQVFAGEEGLRTSGRTGPTST